MPPTCWKRHRKKSKQCPSEIAGNADIFEHGSPCPGTDLDSFIETSSLHCIAMSIQAEPSLIVGTYAVPLICAGKVCGWIMF